MSFRESTAKHRLTTGAVLLFTAGAVVSMKCDGSAIPFSISQPIFLVGPQVTNTEVPTLEILRPNGNISISQGSDFVIEWADTDRDSDAMVSFSLVSIDDSENVIPLVENISENDDTTDRFTVSTRFVPIGSYNLRGTIDDGVNRRVSTFALNQIVGVGAVVVQVVEEGTAATNLPPQVFVRDPVFNLSVSQDDTVVIVVQPMEADPNVDPNAGPIVNDPYDVDSTTLLYLVLDLDDDPLNDDVVDPADPGIIRLLDEPIEIAAGESGQFVFPILVELERIPMRPDGSPYHIRATIVDGQNAPVHRYAAGTLNVVRAASGSVVDLAQVGKTISGARFVGFNPGSRLGTRMISVRDFDADGIDDFILVAQFGNPRNFGNIGEAYLIYGQPNIRFGGAINVNSTARTVPGVIFEAPPTRCFHEDCSLPPTAVFCTGIGQNVFNINSPRTDGITDVSFIPDLNGDFRPELLFGMAHVDGVIQFRDDDPGDNAPTGDETLQVELTLVQPNSEVTIEAEPDDEVIQFNYVGVENVTITDLAPDIGIRDTELFWFNSPFGTAWTLIKFKNVLETFPFGDTPDKIAEGIDGSLDLTVIDTGGDATIHRLLPFVNFNENTTTFNNFLGGQAPIAGIHYDEDEIGSIGAENSGSTGTGDLNNLLQELLFGLLPGNELRFIIVPGDATDEDAFNPASIASKTWADERFRPTITINYDRELGGGPFGCYPDILPNNFADMGNEDAGCNERKLEAMGFVSLIHSSNRDNVGTIDPNRLSSTVVSLELAGQRPANPIESGISAQEQAEGDEPGRIEGCRFQVGWYDFFDANELNQGVIDGRFGQSVSWIADLDLDGLPEILVSAPTNERAFQDAASRSGSTHARAWRHQASITIIPGADYDDDAWRDKGGGTSSIPHPRDQWTDTDCPQPGDCGAPGTPRCGSNINSGTFGIFAEHPDDHLGGARSPGDFNLDSVPDFICGAPRNDRSETLEDSGTMYIIYGRTPTGDFHLAEADDPFTRPPMLRIRGETPGDQIGWRQEPIRDVNGDRIDDVLFSSPTADFIVTTSNCFDITDPDALNRTLFNACVGREVFAVDDPDEDPCKRFDFNNDRVIDLDDREVFDCLDIGGDDSDCCPIDNGYVGIIFGGVDRQGDRTISQLGTSELGGVVFHGSRAGDRAGYDISSGGDFDNDGFGDILISVPGEIRVDENGRKRLGVTYLIYGGPHLQELDGPVDLTNDVGDRIPGIVFLSPFVAGSPDEAPTDSVGFLGDINNDGFGDIAIGVTFADLLDEEFPQGDGTPNDTGRRPDQGDVYIIYGNNIGRQ